MTFEKSGYISLMQHQRMDLMPEDGMLNPKSLSLCSFSLLI